MRTALLFVFLLFIVSSTFSQIWRIDRFGAIPDGQTLNTTAIQRTIDSCFKQGGGTVYVPPGIYITGTLHLKSRISLYLENGAVLKGSSRLDDYEKYSLEGFGVQYYGMLYTENAEDVSISGMGAIDGNDTVFFDWKHAKKMNSKATRFTRQKNNYRATGADLGDGPVVPDSLRPHQMLIFSGCRNVHLQDVTLRNPPFWTLHFADCDAVSVVGLRIWSHMLVPNADGIDVTSCNNVTIANCDIRTGDDAIAITGYDHHFEIPGFKRLRHPCGNIVISNCNLQSYSSGIRIGWLDQNTLRNVEISNINITNSTRGIGIFLRDQGSLENIHFSNINIETYLRTGDWWGNGEAIHISAVKGIENGHMGHIKNVGFDHIFCQAENGIILYGSPDSHLTGISLNDVSLLVRNSKLNAVAGGNIDLRGCLLDSEQLFAHDIPGLYARFTDGLCLTNFKLSWDKEVVAPYFTTGIALENINGIRLTGFEGMSAPVNKKDLPVSFYHVQGVTTDIPKEKILILKKPG